MHLGSGDDLFSVGFLVDASEDSSLETTSLSAFRSVSQAGQRGLVIPIGKLEIRSISLSSKSEGSRR
jgi:hypothetical protein